MSDWQGDDTEPQDWRDWPQFAPGPQCCPAKQYGCGRAFVAAPDGMGEVMCPYCGLLSPCKAMQDAYPWLYGQD